MSVTIQTDLSEVILCKGKVPLKLSSDAFELTAGTVATGDFAITNNPAEDDTLVITWNDSPLVLTWKSTPDNSGLQLPLNGGALTLKLYAQNVLLPALLACAVLDDDFVLEHDDTTASGTGKITLSARKKGSIGLIIACAIASTTVNYTDGTNRVLQSNFSVVVDVWKETTFGSDTWEKYARNLLQVNEAGWILTSMARQLQAVPISNPPDLGLTTIVPDLLLLQRIYYRHGEQYGEDPVLLAMATSAVKQVLYGGYDKSETDGSSFQVQYVSIGSGRRFLTKSPDRVFTLKPSDVGFLYFLGRTEDSTWNANFTLFYDDGTNQVYSQELAGAVGPELKGLYVVPIGVEVLGLHNKQAAKTIVRVDVECTGDDQVDSTEVFTIEIDQNYYRHNTLLLFRNSLGVYETAWFKGDFLSGHSLERADFMGPENPELGAEHFELSTYNYERTEKYEVHSGHWPKAQVKYWERELGQSDEVYWIRDGEKIAVVIAGKGVKPVSEGNVLWSLKIEMEGS